jgi:hypothetical protein
MEGMDMALRNCAADKRTELRARVVHCRERLDRLRSMLFVCLFVCCERGLMFSIVQLVGLDKRSLLGGVDEVCCVLLYGPAVSTKCSIQQGAVYVDMSQASTKERQQQVGVAKLYPALVGSHRLADSGGVEEGRGPLDGSVAGCDGNGGNCLRLCYARALTDLCCVRKWPYPLQATYTGSVSRSRG